MIETEEQRQRELALDGSVMTFTGFTIYGYPGFSITHLYNGETTVYTVEDVKYSFVVTTKDCALHSIVDGTSFTITDGVYTYSFTINNSPLPYMDGWSRITADWIGKVAVA